MNEGEVFLLCADPCGDLGEFVTESHTSFHSFSVLLGIYEKFTLTDQTVRTAQTGKHFVNVLDLLCGIRCAGLLSVTEGRIRDPDLTGHIEGYATMVEGNLRNFIIGIELSVQVRFLYVLERIFILRLLKQIAGGAFCDHKVFPFKVIKFCYINE